MPRKAIVALVVFVFSVVTIGFSQGGAKKQRVEGRVIRSSDNNSTLTVRIGETAEKIVHFSPSTKWVSQYHADKKVNTIDRDEVKDGDYVICMGSYDAKGEFQADTISKRLSHSQ